MIPYSIKPVCYIKKNESSIASFVAEGEQNIDEKTVKSFGEEWETFKNFSQKDLGKIGADYFDILTGNLSNHIALDVGCGSGRWAAYLSPKLKFIEAIDPSSAVFVADEMLKNLGNVRVTHASVENIPFPDSSFDIVYSLGVLHHVPDTESAIVHCSKKIKKGGLFLLYLYYDFENRGTFFKVLFKASDFLRRGISKLPSQSKKIICGIIAGLVYWPLAKYSATISIFSNDLAKKIPLSYYRSTSFFIMRNDALDRFGTPLEKRFSKKEITHMLEKSGFNNIVFSEREPYWHVIATRS